MKPKKPETPEFKPKFVPKFDGDDEAISYPRWSASGWEPFEGTTDMMSPDDLPAGLDAISGKGG
jgi:hypothetical protein